MRLYHGSNEELSELEADNPGYRGSLGYGLYLTTEPWFAEVFGRYVYGVMSPIPDEDVADLTEMNVYGCGNDLVLYTTGSQPFTFSVVNKITGEEERFSVLEDCDDEVKRQLAAGLYRDVMPAVLAEHHTEIDSLVPEERAALRAYFLGYELGEEDESLSRAVEQWAEGLEYEVGGEEAWSSQELIDLSVEIADEIESRTDERVAEILGTELSLDEISGEVEALGYSAFHISGYSRGDEYVIIDDRYLPLPVIGVRER